MKDVEELHLSGNSYGTEACLALAEVLKDLHSLKVANFADIFVSRTIDEIPFALAAICNALKDNTSLVELDLSDNAFGGRSADPMVPFLTTNRSFQVLKLYNNGLGITGGTIVANALIASAKLSKAEGKPSNLKTVICGRNRLENGSAPIWAEAFALHGSLEVVEMIQNGIRMEGIEALAKGLSKCPGLRVLNLNDNTATEKGTRAIALALPSWPKLQTLDLSDCYLTQKGCISLTTALGKGDNKQLEVLKLQYARMDSRGINILAKAIADHMPLLRRLELNGNYAEAEDECFDNIREALKSHGHELDGPNGPDDGALGELDDPQEPSEDEDEGEHDVRAGDESDEEKEEKKGVAETVKEDVDKAVDDLAGLMGKTSLT
jgi:Ran GTPase-activating protein 1